MTVREEIVKNVLAALEREPLVNIHQRPVGVDFADGVVTLTGDVDEVAAKKLALELAGAVPGVTGIVDRLRVVPAEPMEDADIRDHVCDALLQEQAFNDCTIRALVKGGLETVREAPLGKTGVFEVEVEDGVVTINGQLGSLSHKRLAGVLAWWVPGSRDVVNGLEVTPPMEDNDDEVVDAVRLVLEKDPFVNASQLRVSCRNYVVTLDGQVPKEKEREMAEADAWYVFRVNRVVNNIIVAE
ncbi:MAG: BON domain-containing protein [Geobacteraceae bacterium]|nr:BON domain-containing protein [Geobacteraceae bacterium]